MGTTMVPVPDGKPSVSATWAESVASVTVTADVVTVGVESSSFRTVGKTADHPVERRSPDRRTQDPSFRHGSGHAGS